MTISTTHSDNKHPADAYHALVSATRIAFITTCKGRLDHLRQSLPTWVAEAPDEIIVVDYRCPQQSGAWVETHYPTVKVVRVDDEEAFCLAKARNQGAARARSDWLCFIDADIQVVPGWVTWLHAHLDKRFFYRAGPAGKYRVKETYGTFLCTRSAFERSEGYDEMFRGWGGEDVDLYSRLRHTCNLGQSDYPAAFVTPITHDDSLRLAHYDNKDMVQHRLTSRLYLEAKKLLMSTSGQLQQPALDERQAIMQHVRHSVGKWAADKSRPLPTINLNFNTRKLLRGNIRVLQQCKIALVVEDVPAPESEEP